MFRFDEEPAEAPEAEEAPEEEAAE